MDCYNSQGQYTDALLENGSHREGWPSREFEK